MAKIPVRFKRITVAFNEVARARLCQSSGSEHSAAAADQEDNSLTELSDLWDSFFEKDDGNDGVDVLKKTKNNKGDDDDEESETKEMLMSLISSEDEEHEISRRISEEIVKACRSLGTSSEGFKRGAMTWLRQRGFDAGLCKSRWEKTLRQPGGEYEYIDVVVSKKQRYIVEVSLSSEFTIARPTDSYASLLQIIPQVIVRKENELKQLVRLMSNAMRVSMRKRGLNVPPWRKNSYMQNKWFGSYRRTTNMVSMSTMKVPYGVDSSAWKSSVGFEGLSRLEGMVPLRNCRGEVVKKHDLDVGNLKAVFSDMA